jgi:hypothetical protein
VAEIGQQKGTGEEDGCKDRRRPGQKIRTAAGTEKAAGATAAEGRTHVGTFAVLDKDETDHRECGQHLHAHENIEDHVHSF